MKTGKIPRWDRLNWEKAQNEISYVYVLPDENGVARKDGNPQMQNTSLNLYSLELSYIQDSLQEKERWNKEDLHRISLIKQS